MLPRIFAGPGKAVAKEPSSSPSESGRPLAAHVHAAVVGSIQPKITTASQFGRPIRPLAPHVQAAITRAAQPKPMPDSVSSRLPAPHVQKAVSNTSPCKTETLTRSGQPVARHVQAAAPIIQPRVISVPVGPRSSNLQLARTNQAVGVTGIGGIRVRIQVGSLLCLSRGGATNTVVQRLQTLKVKITPDSLPNEGELSISEINITGDAFPPKSKIKGQEEGETERGHEISWDLWKISAANKYKGLKIKDLAADMNCEATITDVEKSYAEYLKAEAKKLTVWRQPKTDNLNEGRAYKYAKKDYLKYRETSKKNRSAKRNYAESALSLLPEELANVKDYEKYEKKRKREVISYMKTGYGTDSNMEDSEEEESEESE